MQHGNSSFFPGNGFPPRCQMTFLLPARATVTYMHMLSSCGGGGGGGGGGGVVGWCEGAVYLTSLGRPTDIGLQLGKACYPCSG